MSSGSLYVTSDALALLLPPCAEALSTDFLLDSYFADALSFGVFGSSNKFFCAFPPKRGYVMLAFLVPEARVAA